MEKKNKKIFSFLRYLHLKLFLQIVSIEKTILILGSQWINKDSQDFAYNPMRLYQPELPFYGSINMVKELSFRFQHCFGPFYMLLCLFF